MLEKNLSPKGVILNWLQPPALQIHLRASHLAGPEGAGEAVEDPSSDEELFFPRVWPMSHCGSVLTPSSDEERATTDEESEVEAEAEEADLPPEEPWCPPIPDAPDDPTEMEIAGAADKLETIMNSSTSGQHLLLLCLSQLNCG